MTSQYPKRLIEVDLPIARISAHARREKAIRHGHISTLHIWWARRPLAACRAVICASLWPDPADELCPLEFCQAAIDALQKFAKRVFPERVNQEGHELQQTLSQESWGRWEALSTGTLTLDALQPADMQILRMALLDFIADFANWDNSTALAYLDTSRALTRAAYESMGGERGARPLVVDPFAGGGSIPLEALRVGADAFASDLNPVPVLLNKVVLEYIPRFGERLADAVQEWGQRIKEKVEPLLDQYFPRNDDGGQPFAYIWARTILSESPGDTDLPVEVPLFRSMWLSNKTSRRFALRWVKDENGDVKTEKVKVIFANGERKTVRRPLLQVFQPRSPDEVEKGTSRAGAATCPITQFTTSVERVRSQLKERSGGGSDARLICVVSTPNKGLGRVYRDPTEQDFVAVQSAVEAYHAIRNERVDGLSLLPDGELNHLRGFFNVVLYGMNTWGDLFAPRQALSLAELVRLVRTLPAQLGDDEFAIAVQTCLALALDRCADKCASVVVWNIPGEKVEHVFGRQALPMVWDFAEANLLADIGWSGACEWVHKAIVHNVRSKLSKGVSVQSSATQHPLPDDSVDAIVTDPPYYAAIPYADLSDFFYSWLKRTVGDLHKDLFSRPLTPKAEECVQLSHRAAMYREKDAAWFEATMTKACAESRRYTKPQGIGLFVFANKETSGWEAMLAALISSGWTITASWPIDTEMGTRLRARNSAALASSVHLVCRPREDSHGNLSEATGEWRDVVDELPKRIHEWMPRLASEGVVGADAIFACLGPALEIFSRYARVEKASGDAATLREYLEHVWAVVSTEALSMIFRDADAAGLEPEARLTAMWLWTLGSGTAVENSSKSEEDDDNGENDEETMSSGTATGFTLEFDAARKIAQGLGAHLEKSESIVELRGDKARLLAVAERTAYLFGKKSDDSAPSNRKAKKSRQQTFFDDIPDADAGNDRWGDLKGPPPGTTVLDRLHQAMILFGASRGELLKRFLVEEGVGQDARFWKLAQSLSALYPPGTDERRWVEGVLARKKGLGL